MGPGRTQAFIAALIALVGSLLWVCFDPELKSYSMAAAWALAVVLTGWYLCFSCTTGNPNQARLRIVTYSVMPDHPPFIPTNGKSLLRVKAIVSIANDSEVMADPALLRVSGDIGTSQWQIDGECSLLSPVDIVSTSGRLLPGTSDTVQFELSHPIALHAEVDDVMPIWLALEIKVKAVSQNFVGDELLIRPSKSHEDGGRELLEEILQRHRESAQRYRESLRGTIEHPGGEAPGQRIP